MSDRAQLVERESNDWAMHVWARSLADLERERQQLVERIAEIDLMRAQILKADLPEHGR